MAKKNEIDVKIQLAVGKMPKYMTEGAAAADLYAAIPEEITIPSGWRAKISLGFGTEIPEGYMGLVLPRSGLADEYGITILNAPGLIDSDYRGTWGAILYNTGNQPFTVNPGDRIAQVTFVERQKANFVLVEELSLTQRGNEGFGTTGR